MVLVKFLFSCCYVFVIELNRAPISGVCCHVSHLWDMPIFGTGAQENTRCHATDVLRPFDPLRSFRLL